MVKSCWGRHGQPEVLDENRRSRNHRPQAILFLQCTYYGMDSIFVITYSSGGISIPFSHSFSLTEQHNKSDTLTWGNT